MEEKSRSRRDYSPRRHYDDHHNRYSSGTTRDTDDGRRQYVDYHKQPRRNRPRSRSRSRSYSFDRRRSYKAYESYSSGRRGSRSMSVSYGRRGSQRRHREDNYRHRGSYRDSHSPSRGREPYHRSSGSRATASRDVSGYDHERMRSREQYRSPYSSEYSYRSRHRDRHHDDHYYRERRGDDDRYREPRRRYRDDSYDRSRGRSSSRNGSYSSRRRSYDRSPRDSRDYDRIHGRYPKDRSDRGDRDHRRGHSVKGQKFYSVDTDRTGNTRDDLPKRMTSDDFKEPQPVEEPEEWNGFPCPRLYPGERKFYEPKCEEIDKAKETYFELPNQGPSVKRCLSEGVGPITYSGKMLLLEKMADVLDENAKYIDLRLKALESNVEWYSLTTILPS